MDLVYQYLFFLAKAVTFVIAFAAIALLIISIRQKKGETPGDLTLSDLGEQYREMKENMQISCFDHHQLKAWRKAEKIKAKAEAKQKKAQAKNSQDQIIDDKYRLFVLDFKGSIDAHEVESLRKEVTAILAVAKPGDEVLLKLESPGGVVHGYGLAASQLDRIKQGGLPLTVAIDKVAASGGYMMACVADKIVSAPFAIVGSIGVIAQIPNFHRLLKKHDVDIELHTAGEFKRTLTMLGENTEQGREKFKHDLNETHGLFKHFVSQHRPSLDINSVATGEYWFGSQAKEKGLVDDIATSDDVILQSIEEKQILLVRYVIRKKLVERLSTNLAESADKLLLRWLQRGQKPLL